MPKANAKRPASGEPLTVPYSSIIRFVPQEFWGKLAPAGVAGYNLTLSRKTVLEQIPHGAVKVSFGELRRGAPAGVFTAGGADDGRLIDLPLAEILAQLHPDSYARRPNQVRIQVSEEVPDLFGTKGERLANVRVMEKKSSGNTSSFARQKVPAASHPSATSAAPIPAPIPSNITPLPMPPAAQPPAAPLQPAPSNAPIPAPAIRMPAPPVVAPPSKPTVNAPPALKPAVSVAQPASRPLPKAPAAKAPAASAPIPFTPFPSPSVAATPAVPVAPIQSSPSLVATANALGVGSVPFLVGIDSLASAWPAGVRQELAQLKIPDAKIAFPTVEICDGLKRGRIQYPWRTLRTWLQPTPFYATPSPYDDTMIELPLSTLTPLFLEFIRDNSTDRGVASSEGITDFFRRAEALAGTSAEPLRTVEQPVSISAPVVIPLPVPTSPAPQAPPAAPPAFAPAAAATPAAQEEVSTGAPPSVSAIENGKLCLPVNQICQSWPEPILRDVQQFSLSGARIEIPVEQVEPGLKSGRIEFTWGELCAWLRPASRAAQVSINAELRLPLPLNVVAPIFVKQRDAGSGKKRVRVEESIPDVFSAAGKPVVASTVASHQTAHVPAPAPGPAPAAESAPSAAQPRKLPATVSELFGEPEKKSWTPNEIVQRTVSLPNVAGSLIAMQDGLLVAHFMPPTVKTETIAAFVPQIFGRLNQYCKELQMGEAHEVSFAVDVGTVHVFNAGIIYFAALSKPGALLPVPELQLITSELSRHTK